MWLTILLVLGLTGILYAWRLNSLILSQPNEALGLSKKRWTDAEIQAAYKEYSYSPLDVKPFLPPKTGHRYIVVGGNGLVGGWIVLHLLARGENPSNIRILDIRSPIRRDLQRKPASQVTFAKVDITNLEEVKKAFDLPWPNDPRNSTPLTVFHTAAIIRFYERSSTLKHISSRVNTLGTHNVLTTAAQAGASYFIYCSTVSVHNQIVKFFVPPWASHPVNFVQVLSESQPVTSSTQCVSNYTQTKGEAENIVLGFNGKGTHSGSMATGTLRPGNMIYGPGGDPSVSRYLKDKVTPVWIQNIIQTQVYVENVSFAHLLFEQRLMEDNATSQDRFGGKSFVITDPNPAVAFGDIYRFLTVTTNGETQFVKLPPLMMLLLSYIVEFYYLYRYRLITAIPSLKALIPELGADITCLQPPLFSTANCHIFGDDSLARASPERGGLGYKAPFTTIMGLCKSVHTFLVKDEDTYTVEEANSGHTITRAEHGVGVLASKVGMIEKS